MNLIVLAVLPTRNLSVIFSAADMLNSVEQTPLPTLDIQLSKI